MKLLWAMPLDISLFLPKHIPTHNHSYPFLSAIKVTVVEKFGEPRCSVIKIISLSTASSALSWGKGMNRPLFHLI